MLTSDLERAVEAALECALSMPIQGVLPQIPESLNRFSVVVVDVSYPSSNGTAVQPTRPGMRNCNHHHREAP
jgi:hypothetical protein